MHASHTYGEHICSNSFTHDFVFKFACAALAASSGGWEFRGPHLTSNPASTVEFSNSSGASIDCWASSSEPVALSWIDLNRNSVVSIPGLRYLQLYFTLVIIICSPPLVFFSYLIFTSIFTRAHQTRKDAPTLLVHVFHLSFSHVREFYQQEVKLSSAFNL